MFHNFCLKYYEISIFLHLSDKLFAEDGRSKWLNAALDMSSNASRLIFINVLVA